MSAFEIPGWVPSLPEPAAPPPDPMVAREQQIADTTRAEQGLNQFLAAKQAALFEAPDAFYRQQSEDAIHAAPVATQKLDDLRRDLLDRLGNDTQRQRLSDALDAQMHLARESMARHVAEQSLAWQRGVAQDRIALLAKEAAHHHNDDELIDALGHAAANAARAHSRVGDGPPGGDAEDAAAATARSGVLGAAIQARLDRGDTAGANTLFTQVQGQLDPEHAAPLQGQLDAGLMVVLPYRPSLDDSDIKVEPLPYKPPMDGTLDEASILKNLADVREGESTPGQNSGGIIQVNATPDDANGTAQADPQLAQASPPGSIKKQPAAPADSAKNPPAASEELEKLGKELEKTRSEQRDKREPLWDAMTKAEPPDGAPGTKKQAPLSDDWRADVNKINPTYADLVEKIAKQHGIPPELLARLLAKESNFNKDEGTVIRDGTRVRMRDKAVGIPQMYPDAAKDVGVTIQQLIDGTPEFQINAGAAYLAQKYKQFKDWPKAVAAYHSGAPTMEAWFKGEGPDYENVDQRKLGYPKLDTSGSTPILRPVLPDPNRVQKEVNNWTELKGYLPYMFLGDPDRYKYVRVPEYP